MRKTLDGSQDEIKKSDRKSLNRKQLFEDIKIKKVFESIEKLLQAEENLSRVRSEKLYSLKKSMDRICTASSVKDIRTNLYHIFASLVALKQLKHDKDYIVTMTNVYQLFREEDDRKFKKFRNMNSIDEDKIGEEVFKVIKNVESILKIAK